MVNKLNTDSRLCSRATWQSFDNCREQGFVLNIWGMKLVNLRIAFSENRNSDDIVVYCYTKSAFPTNLPAEDSWNDKMYFPYKKHLSAAKYVLVRASAFLDGIEMTAEDYEKVR